MSFILISLNDHKNLNYIFEKCNLRVKKILLKSFILGANISENFKDVETFYQLKINKNNSKIFFSRIILLNLNKVLNLAQKSL